MASIDLRRDGIAFKKMFAQRSDEADAENSGNLRALRCFVVLSLYASPVAQYLHARDESAIVVLQIAFVDAQEEDAVVARDEFG